MSTSSGRISKPNAALPEYLVKRYITSAEILAAFTVPITIIPAVIGYMVHCFAGHWYREPGTAYTLNGATNLFVRATGVAGGAQLHTFDASPLSATTGFSVISSGPSSTGTGLGAALFSTNYADQPMVFHIGTAQPTLGTGGIFLSVFYHLFPNGAF